MRKNKKAKEKKSPYKYGEKVRIRKSYYTFSKEYPSKYIRFQKQKSKNGRQRRKRAAAVVFSVLGFVFLVCFSYFITNVCLDISFSEAPVTEAETQSEDTGAQTLVQSGEVRALYMPYSELGNIEYIKDLISEIKSKNGNSVVIDFKNPDGKLAYSSIQEYALTGKCALFDNNTVRRALDCFESSNITVIAGIYCFEDNTVPIKNPELAVKYMNTEVNWLDGSDAEGGNAWLNPLSSEVRGYIKSIITELLDFKIKGFLLKSVQFPEGELISSATYPGEKKSTDRNKVLKKFVKSIYNTLPSDCFLLVSLDADDALEGNDKIYFGSVTDISADGIVADTSERDEAYIIDKSTEYVSMLSLFSSIADDYPDKLFVPQIDVSEYSHSYFRALRKSGYNSFILYSETGEY